MEYTSVLAFVYRRNGYEHPVMRVLCKPSEVTDMVRENYDMEVIDSVYLNGYEDLNIRLQVRSLLNNEIQKVVLKLSPFTDKKVVSLIDVQAQMMNYLAAKGILVSSVLRTSRNGLYFTSGSYKGTKFCGRMLTYIDGTALQDLNDCLPVMESVGRFVGQMDAALKDFTPRQQEDVKTEWGLSNALLLRDMLPEYCPRDACEIGREILHDYDTRLLPVKDRFSKGYIHGDIIGTNIYVTKNAALNENGGWSISGLIDFGDACVGTYVYEIAILLADVMAHQPANALEAGKQLLAGFSSEFELNVDEFLFKVMYLRAAVASLYSDRKGSTSCPRESSLHHKVQNTLHGLLYLAMGFGRRCVQ